MNSITFIKRLRNLCLLLQLFYGSTSFGLFDGQFLVGRSWYSTDDDGGTAHSTYGIAGHVDPIPLLPISFGVMITSSDLLDREKTEGVDVDPIFNLGLDVMGWIPFVPVVTPYGRLTLLVHGKSGTKADGIEVEMDLSEGHLLSFGAKYPLLPLIEIFAEVGRGVTMLKLTKCTNNGSDCLDLLGGGGKSALKQDRFVIGVQAGI